MFSGGHVRYVGAPRNMKNSYAISVESNQETLANYKVNRGKRLESVKKTLKTAWQTLFKSRVYFLVLLGTCLTGLTYLCFLRLLGVVGTEFIGVTFAASELPTFFVCLFIGTYVCHEYSIIVTDACYFARFLIYHVALFSALVLITGSISLANPEIVKNTNTIGGICMIVFGSIFFFVSMIL